MPMAGIGYMCNGDSDDVKLIFFLNTAYVNCGVVIQNAHNLMDLGTCICNETQVSILWTCGSNPLFLKVIIVWEMSTKQNNIF